MPYTVPPLGEMYSIQLYVINVVCRVFFYGISINEAVRHGITEVFLDVEFNTHNLNNSRAKYVWYKRI
jgi:hypothetical protein